MTLNLKDTRFVLWSRTGLSTGIVVFAHGSSIASANEAVRAVAQAAARDGDLQEVEVAFLEPVLPDLGQAVARLVERGVSRIAVVPYFLTMGIHLQRDLPGIVDRLSRAHKGVEILVTQPLDGHPGLAEILVDRAREALSKWP